MFHNAVSKSKIHNIENYAVYTAPVHHDGRLQQTTRHVAKNSGSLRKITLWSDLINFFVHSLVDWRLVCLLNVDYLIWKNRLCGRLLKY